MYHVRRTRNAGIVTTHSSNVDSLVLPGAVLRRKKSAVTHHPPQTPEQTSLSLSLFRECAPAKTARARSSRSRAACAESCVPMV